MDNAKQNLQLFAEYISELKADPHCRVAGCWGRGYLGIQRIQTKDGPKDQLLLCKCASFGETEYVRFQKHIDQALGFIHAASTGQFKALARRTFWGGIAFVVSWPFRWAKTRIANLRKRQRPNPPAAAATPPAEKGTKP